MASLRLGCFGVELSVVLNLESGGSGLVAARIPAIRLKP